MRRLLLLSIFLLLAQQIVAPPVTKTQESENNNEVHETPKDALGLEYDRYLQEVVSALEQDTHFRNKLEKADENYIRSGKIAKELEFVNHRVRTTLDELKRTELERLKELHHRKRQLGESHDSTPPHAPHIDQTNQHTFEIQDLKKLIQKTNEDLAEADRRRKQEFKEYEMEKKFEEEEKMKTLNEEEKKKYAAELEAMKEKHKKHQPLHHPGSKQQLEEVWEKQDHMTDEEFNPKTFFYMHDLDGDGYWDQYEVEALFVKELDKMYNDNPEDDIRERQEDMERMREHMFAEADTNQDGLIDYNEFLGLTKKKNFQEDPGWEGLDKQEHYSQQEYDAYQLQKQQEMQRMAAQGLRPPYPDVGHQGQFPPQHVDPSQLHHQGQVPPAYPPQYQGQVPVQHQQYQGQVPLQHQQYQGQVPVQQQYQGQVPLQQQQVPVHNQQPVPAQGQIPIPQQPVQQQYQPPPQQLPLHQVPSVQVPPNVAQQPVVNNQIHQENVPAVNQQHQPGQVQNIPTQQPPQPVNPVHNGSPNVVHA
ncbi:nucleobindin-2 isoform X2 [Diachasmimorpha longicaudata]